MEERGRVMADVAVKLIGGGVGGWWVLGRPSRDGVGVA